MSISFFDTIVNLKCLNEIIVGDNVQDKKILVEEFINHCLIAEETPMTGDYKRGNKSNKALLANLEQLKQLSELTTGVLD